MPPMRPSSGRPGQYRTGLAPPPVVRKTVKDEIPSPGAPWAARISLPASFEPQIIRRIIRAFLQDLDGRTGFPRFPLRAGWPAEKTREKWRRPHPCAGSTLRETERAVFSRCKQERGNVVDNADQTMGPSPLSAFGSQHGREGLRSAARQISGCGNPALRADKRRASPKPGGGAVREV